MFIKIIKSTNEGIFSKMVELNMYKICIKTYLHIKQILLLKQCSQNTII